MHTIILTVILSFLITGSPADQTEETTGSLRLRVIAETPYEAAYFFDKEGSKLTTVSMETGLDISETANYIAGIFHTTTGENITVELYKTVNGVDMTTITGNGRVLVLTTTPGKDGEYSYGIHVRR